MIEHETAASRDTYAVVDKPSEKKRGPDTVPPPSEGVSGAVLSSMHAVTIFCSVHVHVHVYICTLNVFVGHAYWFLVVSQRRSDTT